MAHREPPPRERVEDPILRGIVARAREHAPSNVGAGVSGHKPGPLSRGPTQPFRPRIPGRRAGEKGERSIGADLPRIAAAMASAVIGASRMPFRVWPVA